MSRLLRLRPITLPLAPRRFNSSSSSSSSPFSRGPSPPRLPAEQQAEFERLQRAASVSSAFQHIDPHQHTDPSEVPDSSSSSSVTSAEAATATATTDAAKPATPQISNDEETMHPAYVRGAPPEFEGDVNPRTGEVGGPKREPLRWGSGGDWSYNGRVTDF